MDKLGKTFKKSHVSTLPLLLVIGMEGISLYTNSNLLDKIKNDMFKIIH